MKTLALLQLGHLGLKGAKVEVAAADMVVEGAQILGVTVGFWSDGPKLKMTERKRRDDAT